MPIPSDYFYRQGWYWKVDGTGPYIWSGTSMALFDFGIPATSTAQPLDGHLFNQDETGPATRS